MIKYINFVYTLPGFARHMTILLRQKWLNQSLAIVRAYQFPLKVWVKLS